MEEKIVTPIDFKDVAGNYDPARIIFTAPQTGVYLFNGHYTKSLRTGESIEISVNFLGSTEPGEAR